MSTVAPPTATTPSCANCRHHTARMVPKMREDAEQHIDGSYFVAEDTDVKTYACTLPKKPESPFGGTEIGLEPVHCESWALPATGAARDEADTRMRDMVSAWEARQRARADRDQR